MNIIDLLDPNVMILDLKAKNKAEAIDEMAASMEKGGIINDIGKFKEGIWNREKQTSTGLGEGIAMPHTKNSAVNKATVLFAKSNDGIDYEALDGQPVYVFFMIAAPDGANDTHLQALASLSRYLMKDGFVDKLRLTKTPQDVIDLFKNTKIDDDEEESEPEPTDNADRPYLVAVTACTTGIAHTYMAEEALKKEAAKENIDIKVETNGASGVEHRLTASEIEKAAGIIVAADKKVEMDRFNGKHLVQRPVAAGIREPEKLISEALSGNAPIFHSDNENSSSSESDGDKKSVGGAFYQHLMSGVSAMLPFVIGGGIAIALAFLIDQTMGVPHNALSQLGTYHPIAAFFKQIGNAAFNFMLPVLAGYIAYSMAEKPGLVAGFVAGSLAASGYNLNNIGLDPKNAPIPSGFLGALVGGFLAGWLMLLLKKWFKGAPRSIEGIISILVYPVLGVIITGFMMLIINIPMGWINQGINGFLTSLTGTNAAILGLIVGGMMAIDMGGPFNKAAYVFGTATIASTVSTGGSVAMASVMAGGMTPPLAIFVASILFKNKFTVQEREAGLTNIIMGLSFITEGAIPFAASDPARAIPSFVVGSAVAGGLVGMSGIKLLAPHGGIFVIALTSNPLLYLLYIAIGAIISGVILGLLRKPVEA
ncbi:PTS fructose transporter subunit IIABC [Xylocopilactobacillus apicola]|uniref:PTS fructose transporter subunit IIC n=1 Tax=Xylocopilactobacillus apicola TaxID=2932184 RepID=A0AAU9DXT0_9LACO|nr:fructose-specific PTS transporter subunit EIIC [Xylocopilactobacillus apicola]BDR58938.1 PTS fructose transporter subunit IIC [Xylocopilactobacillus apicola]